MLAGMPWRDPDDVIGVVPPAMGVATLRNIAVNAVMAGCRPAYLPVVVAALSAVLEKPYGLAHRQTTTHAGAPLLIVNGPDREELGLNYGNGVFGPGWRANATIGRGAAARAGQSRRRDPGRGRLLPARPSGQVHLLHRRASRPPIRGSRCMSSAASRPTTASSPW